MSPVLVDYRCAACGRTTERWVARPAPATVTSPCCAVPARRRFGGRLAGRATEARPATGGEIPGLCTLVPTAARSLAARVRGDGRALEREQAYQEAAIARGELDPSASPVRAHPGTSVGRSGGG